MKERFTLKKIFTLKKVMVAFAVIAVLAAIAVPLYLIYVQNSRNSAAQKLLQKIALAEMPIQTECPSPCPPVDAFTDGLTETAEEAIMKFAQYGFRPAPADINGEGPLGFIDFAAHNSVGSTVYVYDNIGGVGIKEARENNVHGGVIIRSDVAALYCYEYDPANTAAPVRKKPTRPNLRPNPVIPTPLA